jgi:signal transduction histidine kinase
MVPVAAPRRSDPAAQSIRRVGLRLAALTVGLLLALLIAVVLVVYFTTQALMLQSLRDLARSGAARQAPALIEALMPDEGARPRPTVDMESETGGVVVAFADSSLLFLGGDARLFGAALPDRASAAAALRSGADRSSITQRAHEGYLIYTLPVRARGRIVGVLQAVVSTRQYDQGMHALLEALLVVGALSLLAAAIITLVVVRRALVPIRRSLRRQRDFVADAAHELRTPLSVLHAGVELGLASADPGEQEVALTHALIESRHLARLVDDLALLARADSGAQSLDLQPVDLGVLATEVVQGMEMLADDQGVQMETRIAEVARVHGDRGRLRQLLVILLDNALQHTPTGGTITVIVDRSEGKVRLRVQDTGPGIAPADLPRLFDRFYRATGERRAAGGGLGLAIARWIAEAHGGQIAAGNVVPRGVVFTMEMPLRATPSGG